MAQANNQSLDKPGKRSINFGLIIGILAVILIILGVVALEESGKIGMKNSLTNLENEKSQLTGQKSNLENQLQQLTDQNTQLQQQISLLEQTNKLASWNSYTNEFLGLSFKYPQDWVVIEDNLPTRESEMTYGETGLTQYLLIGIKVNNQTPLPVIKLYIDPMGWGAATPDKRLDIKRSAGQNFEITSEQITGEDLDSTLYQIGVFDQSEGSLRNIFMTADQSATASQAEWDNTVKDIVSTIQFSDQTEQK